MLNGLSVDVEDAFHASAFEREMPSSGWLECEQRAAGNVDRLLELFARHGVRGTFFTLGWIAEHQPHVVRRIHAAGHEIACHGYGHRLIYKQSPAAFREDVNRARTLLEDLTGAAIAGYRAPSYSITPRSLWALDVLAEAGFTYDSSIFPVQHDRYGFPGAPRFPYHVKCPGGATLIELPPSSLRMGRTNVPVAGGGYFRLYPFAVTRLAIAHLNTTERQPAFVYVHPWEIDPEQPRLTPHAMKWWRHSVNLDRTLSRLDRLLGQFRFGTLQEVIDKQHHLSTVALAA